VKTLGWEANKRQRLGARMIDLHALMDPKALASGSVDLNLKLMRWRALPSLRLEKITGSKCLLLGAGTLGCNVARALLGWGVRHITLVDNGRVSFSNPVRQSLFEFKDCLNRGKPKAACAAAQLERIFPGVRARGIQLTIPMPGHTVAGDADIKQCRDDVARLTQLIKEHDVVFFLTDSRESRWLPTLLCAATGTLAINSALGFDSFLVMRHGCHFDKKTKTTTSIDDDENDGISTDKARLGCYFCNDVVAPTDSLTDRTLDQQCTVTRPGLSFMASAMAVELFVSVLHHARGAHAPAELPDTKPTMAFGLVPHQIRGFLDRFNTTLLHGASFDNCTACSPVMLRAYAQRGFAFVLESLNDPASLEQLSGLTALKAAADAAFDDADMDLFDDDSDDCLL
jgi:ubiquitin-like modifier-activating enzyme ATG7